MKNILTWLALEKNTPAIGSLDGSPPASVTGPKSGNRKRQKFSSFDEFGRLTANIRYMFDTFLSVVCGNFLYSN